MLKRSTPSTGADHEIVQRNCGNCLKTVTPDLQPTCFDLRCCPPGPNGGVYHIRRVC
jgi:hypothetical protein